MGWQGGPSFRIGGNLTAEFVFYIRPVEIASGSDRNEIAMRLARSATIYAYRARRGGAGRGGW